VPPISGELLDHLGGDATTAPGTGDYGNPAPTVCTHDRTVVRAQKNGTSSPSTSEGVRPDFAVRDGVSWLLALRSAISGAPAPFATIRTPRSSLWEHTRL